MEVKRRKLPPKQRSIPGRLQHTTYSKAWGITTKGETKSSTDVRALTGTQYTASENHPRWRSRKKRDLEDIGGAFFTQKQYVEGSIPSQRFSGVQDTTSLLINWTYTGPVLPFGLAVPPAWPPAFPSDNDRLDELGAEAVANCKPTNSVADLSAALGETIRDGLPALAGAAFWKDRTLEAKKAGSEYLNVEFGWKPLVSDITKAAFAVDRADKIIRQYHRDSGKVVRRRWEFPTETVYDDVIVATGVSVGTQPSGYNMYTTAPPSGQVRRIRKMTTRRWFSGAFTYYLPTVQEGDWSNVPAEAKKLLGLSLTPDVLWNVGPWSWLVDWFTNAGDVISNLTDFAVDGLVMRYGYIMEHTVCRDTYIFEGPTGLSNPSPRPAPLTFVTETKQRRKANPFGFGVTWDGLSDRQNAILAALGLTKL